MWVVTSLVVVAVGRDHDANFGVGASLMMATTGVASAALFMAVGAVTSQLAPARRSAATLAAAIFGALFLVRVVADTTASLGWLRWATPLGWIESVHPLTDPRPLPLVGVALLTAALFATSVLLAGRRDLGASIVRTATPPRRAPACSADRSGWPYDSAWAPPSPGSWASARRACCSA